MFSKEHRLSHEKDVKAVVRNGRSVFDAVCGVKYKRNDLDVSRFAVVAGTKVHKSAVRRNRVRRQYREIIKAHMEELKTGYDVVLLTSKKALDLDYSEKEERLLGVLRKAKLL